VALVAALPARAAETERRGPPLWELGAMAFGVSQQAYPGADEQLDRALLLPTFIYRGKLLRARVVKLPFVRHGRVLIQP
jgi:hypothetical protein